MPTNAGRTRLPEFGQKVYKLYRLYKLYSGLGGLLDAAATPLYYKNRLEPPKIYPYCGIKERELNKWRITKTYRQN